MTRYLPRFLIGLAFVALTYSPLRGETPLEAIGRLIPNDAIAVVASTNLRAASDDLAQSIEAMDRGHLLLGSKPLDQLKAVLGFSVGVNDLGGAAVVLMPPPEDASADEPAEGPLLAIVAVTEARAFLRGNFADGERHPDHGEVLSVRHARWGTMHARSFGSHVALAREPQVLARMNAPVDGPGFSEQMMDVSSRATARRGHVFVWMRDDLERTAQAMPEILKAVREAMPSARGFDHAVASIRFDPLGFFVRSTVAFDPESVGGRVVKALAAAQPEEDVRLPQLPDRPFILAASVDARRFSEKAIEGLDVENKVLFGLDSTIATMEFGWYPPPAESAAGSRGAAIAILRGGDAAARQKAVEDCVTPQAERWTVEWERGLTIAGTPADGFEVKFERRFPFDGFFEEMFYFGPRRGYVSEAEKATFVSLGQREAAFEFARDAAAGRFPPLHENDVIGAMQEWMPAGRIVEVYIDPGELAALNSGGAMQPGSPQFEQGMPPIAFGLAPRERHAESMLIFPAGVLAPMLDAAMEEMSERVRQRLRSGQP